MAKGFTDCVALLADAMRAGMEVEWSGPSVYVVASRRRDGIPEKAVVIAPANLPNRSSAITGQVFTCTNEIRAYLGLAEE